MAFLPSLFTPSFQLDGWKWSNVDPRHRFSASRQLAFVLTMAAKKGRSGRFQRGKVRQPESYKTKLEPEAIFYEGRPSWTEAIIPFLSIVTVVGIIPFMAALARQAWVRYKITSRRISIDSGFRGKEHVEVVYRDVRSVKYVRRMMGASADMVIALKDGAKLELRAVQDYDKIFDYIMTKVPEDARAASGPA